MNGLAVTSERLDKRSANTPTWPPSGIGGLSPVRLVLWRLPPLPQSRETTTSKAVAPAFPHVRGSRSKCGSARISSSPWIRQRQTLLIVGPTGTGKTWLACALGQSACRQGHTVRYVRLPRLLSDELVLARADGSYGKLMQTMAKTDLLILDDWGLAPLGDRERRDLLELVEERAGRRATLVTSQLPIEHWHEMIGDATFGDAILDRLVHHAHRLTLTGGSLRRLAPTKLPAPHAD